MYKLFIASILVAAVAAGPRTAAAGEAFGTWKSDSGATFVIPESKTDFDLIVTRPDGTQVVYKGRWVDGEVGTKFQYGDNKADPCVARFSRKDPDKIRVTCADDQKATWLRVATQRHRTGGIVGTWRSTSGFHFAIPKFSKTEFDILMTSPTGVKTLMKAQWIEVGTQFEMGKYTCTFDEDDRDEIRVVASDEKFIWQRE